MKTDNVINMNKSFMPVEQSIDKLSKLIREILQLARIDAEQDIVRFSRVSLSKLVKGIVEYVEVICTQNKINVHTDIGSNIFVNGNEKQLEEILTNILSNAVHYTATCVTREIFVTLTVSLQTAQIIIRDTGIGITEENLPHIYERFYRAHEKDSLGKPGNGLGLAIVKQLVEKHLGKITAKSDFGMGTEIIITLPRVI
jgi:signal transduction histidine kinase